MKPLLLGIGLLLMIASYAQGQALTGTLAKIKATNELVIGFRDAAPPYAFIGRDQKIQGYSIEVCQRIIQVISATIGHEIEVKYVPTTAATRTPLVANGTVDLDCGNAVLSQARMKQVDFTIPVYFSSSRFAVPESSSITGLKDMIGKRLAVVQGTNADWYFTALAEKTDAVPQVLRLREASEAILSVTTGRADAFAGDEVSLLALRRANPLAANLKIVGEPFIVNAFGFMLRRDDSQFRLLLNSTLSDMIQKGELVNLAEKWMGPLGVAPGSAVIEAHKMFIIPPA